MNDGICPICERAIEPGQKVLKQWWQEMESDDLQEVKVHEYCGWQSIREVLYLNMDQAEQKWLEGPQDSNEFPSQPLMGWEPHPLTPPWSNHG